MSDYPGGQIGWFGEALTATRQGLATDPAWSRHGGPWESLTGAHTRLSVYRQTRDAVGDLDTPEKIAAFAAHVHANLTGTPTRPGLAGEIERSARALGQHLPADIDDTPALSDLTRFTFAVRAACGEDRASQDTALACAIALAGSTPAWPIGLAIEKHQASWNAAAALLASDQTAGITGWIAVNRLVRTEACAAAAPIERAMASARDAWTGFPELRVPVADPLLPFMPASHALAEGFEHALAAEAAGLVRQHGSRAVGWIEIVPVAHAARQTAGTYRLRGRRIQDALEILDAD